MPRIKIPKILWIIILALIARLPMLWNPLTGQIKQIWYDESYSLFFASQPFTELLKLTTVDTTPALFVVVLRLWQMIFGGGVIISALLPLIFSIISVYIIFIMAKRYRGEKFALWAALLLAVNPLTIKYSTEIRAYSLALLLGLLSSYFLFRYAEESKYSNAAGWIIFSILGAYAHFTFLALFAIQNIYLGFRIYNGNRKLYFQWGICLLIFGLFNLPQILTFQRWSNVFNTENTASYFSRTFQHFSLESVISYLPSLGFGEYFYYSYGWMFLAALITIPFVFWGLWKMKKDQWNIFMALGLLGGFVLLMAMKFIYAPRYFLIFLPFAAILTVEFISQLKSVPRKAAIAATTALIFIGIINTWNIPKYEIFKYYGRPFSEYLNQNSQIGDLLLTDHYTDILFHQYPTIVEQKLFFPKQGGNVNDLVERFRYFDYSFITAADENTLSELTRDAERVWIVEGWPQRSSLQDPLGITKSWFDDNFTLIDQYDFPDNEQLRQHNSLLLYQRK